MYLQSIRSLDPQPMAVLLSDLMHRKTTSSLNIVAQTQVRNSPLQKNLLGLFVLAIQSRKPIDRFHSLNTVCRAPSIQQKCFSRIRMSLSLIQMSGAELFTLVHNQTDYEKDPVAYVHAVQNTIIELPPDGALRQQATQRVEGRDNRTLELIGRKSSLVFLNPVFKKAQLSRTRKYGTTKAITTNSVQQQSRRRPTSFQSNLSINRI